MYVNDAICKPAGQNYSLAKKKSSTKKHRDGIKVTNDETITIITHNNSLWEANFPAVFLAKKGKKSIALQKD